MHGDTGTTAPIHAPHQKRKPKTRLNRLKAFLRRHNALMTFLGAAVVFATFIYKDVLQEEQKDRSDTLQAGQTAFLIRESIISLSQKLMQSSQEKWFPVDIRTNHTPGNYATLQENLENRAFLAWESLQPLHLLQAEAFDNIARFAEVIPKKALPTNFDSFVQIEKRIQSKINSPERLDSIATNTPIITPERSPSEADWAQLFLGFEKLNNAVVTIQREGWENFEFLKNWQTLLVPIAVDQGRIAERRYHRFRRFSYYLYGLGFLLGLVGKLVGKETVEEGE